MYKISLLTAVLFSASVAFSQPAGVPKQKAETSDPAAKSLLDRLRKKYEGYKTLEMEFSLQIEVPGQPTENQKGTFKSEGDSKFRLDMPDQTIISDGTTTWIHLKKNNEVQITDADPKGEQSLISPRELIKIYQKGEYLYTLTAEEKMGDRTTQNVEFKPVSKKSEYSKLRLAIDKKTQQLASIKAFAKDGGRYTFTVKSQSPDKKMEAALFTWDKAKNPNVKVEDLRM